MRKIIQLVDGPWPIHGSFGILVSGLSHDHWVNSPIWVIIFKIPDAKNKPSLCQVVPWVIYYIILYTLSSNYVTTVTTLQFTTMEHLQVKSHLQSHLWFPAVFHDHFLLLQPPNPPGLCFLSARFGHSKSATFLWLSRLSHSIPNGY